LVLKGVYDGNMSEYHEYVADLNGGDKEKAKLMETE